MKRTIEDDIVVIPTAAAAANSDATVEQHQHVDKKIKIEEEASTAVSE
jgi:hypothetical protein